MQAVKPRAKKWEQTSLFDCMAVAEADEPLPEPVLPPDKVFPLLKPQAERFYQTKADVYLQLMNRMMRSKLPRNVKAHELARLHNLRQQALMMVRPGDESTC